MTVNERNKMNYQKRKEQGICVRCGINKATKGVMCNKCREERTMKRKAQKEPNYNCVWYNGLHGVCETLICLNCKYGKCSFYETEAEHKERQRKFNNSKSNKRLF